MLTLITLNNFSALVKFMKKIVLWDTAVATTNQGDAIIMEGVRKGLKPIFKDNYVVPFPTHTTPFSIWQSHFGGKLNGFRMLITGL